MQTKPPHCLRAKSQKSCCSTPVAVATALLLTACLQPRTSSVRATQEGPGAEAQSLITFDQASLCAYNQVPEAYLNALRERGWLLESGVGTEPTNQQPVATQGEPEIKLTKDHAEQIYKLIAQVKSPVDQVTGLANRLERVPTLINISTRLAKPDSDLVAAYVEVDPRNLGGLKEAMGSHTAADAIFKKIADMVHGALRSLEAQFSDENQKVLGELCAFRHGGDEFSFTLHAPAALVEQLATTSDEISNEKDPSAKLIALVDRALKAASATVEKFATDEDSKLEITEGDETRTLKLNEIPHPKKCGKRMLSWKEPLCQAYKGVGIYYGLAPVAARARVVAPDRLGDWLGTCVINQADMNLLEAKKARLKELMGRHYSDDVLSEETPTRLNQSPAEQASDCAQLQSPLPAAQ